MIDQITEYLGTTKFRCTALICIILIFIMVFTKPRDNSNYRCPRAKIDAQIIQLVKEKERHLHDKMWLSCKEGMLKGAVTGSITGGIAGAVSGGAVFAIANPVLVYITS